MPNLLYLYINIIEYDTPGDYRGQSPKTGSDEVISHFLNSLLSGQ